MQTAFTAGLELGNNTVYVPDGNATITCGKASMDIATFQAQGYVL